MSEWTSIAVDSTMWWPSRLLAARHSWQGLSTLPLVRLGDVATVRTVASPIAAPLPLATPRDIDAATGQVAPRQRVDDGDALVLGEDLQPGDVLVPTHGGRPCVLVSEDARGIAFRAFLAVRPSPEFLHPSWLWAVLSSASGVRARESLMAGAMAPKLSVAALLDLLIPLAPLSAGREVGVLVPRPLVLESAYDELRSAWQLRDLRRQPKWSGLSAEEEPDGIPLAELGTFRTGGVDKKNWYAAPGPGRMPVLTHRAVRGHVEPFRQWASGGWATTEATVAFTRTEPFRVARAPAGMLLSRDIVALELGEEHPSYEESRLQSAHPPADHRLAEALVAYFSLPGGKKKLAGNAQGAAIRRLSPSGLGNVRIPRDVLSLAKSSATLPLAERVETMLRHLLPR